VSFGQQGTFFFPWWDVGYPLEIESIRLLPYEHKRQPGDLNSATQIEIDEVLGAYSNLPRSRVRRATLLELKGWRSGAEPDGFLNAIFVARDLIAFAALSERQLFVNHYYYCCFDTFSLVVQRYNPTAPGQFAYSTRKRDGGTTSFWSSKEFGFRRPLHVSQHDRVTLNEGLLRTLLLSGKSHWLDAIRDFNRANTDSNDVSPHVELIMMKSAFESLLIIGEKRADFETALLNALSDIEPTGNFHGPLLEKWRSRGERSRPLLAWAYDFCDRRGSAAHGTQRHHPRFVWSEHAHLAFASILFPLVLKKIASDEGLFELSFDDIETLKRIDRYVLFDPFEEQESIRDEHPWSLIRKEILLSKITAGLHARTLGT
jgi:hypothetical protein